MSFGEELRRERELRQISLREIARATKIDQRRLEELERNDFSSLPGGVYNRGYVRAYCDHIGVDPEAMVNAYLLELREQEASPSAHPGESGLLRGNVEARTKAVEFESDGTPRGRSLRRSRGLWAVVCVIVLLVVGALVVWWKLAGDSAPVDRPTPTQESVGSRSEP